MKNLSGLPVTATYKNCTKIMAHTPKHVGTVLDFNFYEHPFRGEDSPLLVTCSRVANKICLSEFWELPHLDDLILA